MKKKFIKPEIQKITLNFHENIVASNNQILDTFYADALDHYTCILVESGYTYAAYYADRKNLFDAVDPCFVSPSAAKQVARSIGLD